jgi:hypothetical protein
LDSEPEEPDDPDDSEEPDLPDESDELDELEESGFGSFLPSGTEALLELPERLSVL